MEKKPYYDVAIIGAGPVGSHIARTLSKKKVSVALIEQHTDIGYPINCAGIVSSRIFENFNIPREEIVQNTLKNANIHSPDGSILRIGDGRPQAYRIDRSKFDKYLANEAKKNGSEFYMGEKALSIQRDKISVNVETSKQQHIQSDVLVGADGPYSRVRDVFGFPQPREYLQGLGMQLHDTNLDGFRF